MKRLIMAIAIAGFGMAFTGTAKAYTQTTTGAMNISASVPASCTVTTVPIVVGNLNPTTATYQTSTITVNCASGTAYRVDIDAGQYSGINYRRLKTGTAAADTTNTVGYELYKSASYTYTNEWGDNGATFCTTCVTIPTGVTGTGTGVDQTLTVHGGFWAFGSQPAGTYSDTVTVTVNY